MDFLPRDAEPAEKIPVAAAAAVGGFDLFLQVVGPLARLLVAQFQFGLHPFADLLPGLLGQRGRHLLGLFGGVFRPEAVVIGAELPLQLAQHTGRLPDQPAVRRGRCHDFALFRDALIGVLPHIGQRPFDAAAVQPVDDVFHRDITGQAPQTRVALPFHPEMSEYAVEYRMKIQPVEILRILLIEPQQGAGLVAEDAAIGGQHTAPLIRGGRQRRKCQVEKAEVQIQPAAHHSQHLTAHPYLPLLVGLRALRFKRLAGVEKCFFGHRFTSLPLRERVQKSKS